VALFRVLVSAGTAGHLGRIATAEASEQQESGNCELPMFIFSSWDFVDVRLSQEHVLDALGVTDDWYRECNETLSLVIAYGERGERWESPRAVAACRDRAPPKSRYLSLGTGSSRGPTDLLVVLREVHEEYCERICGSNGQARASSVEST